jgi:hypothetical protein
MTRSNCFGLCACLALSLTALACGSSNSGPSTGGSWDQARMGTTGTKWWINATKGAYFFSNQIGPSYECEADGQTQVIDFTKAMTAKLTSGSPGPMTLLPTSGEISGWAYGVDDITNQTITPQGATTQMAATDLIDGGADPFFTTSYSASAFGMETYQKDTYLLDARVWQMASAADAGKLFTGLLSNSLYSQANIRWQPCTETTCPPPVPTADPNKCWKD